MYTFWNSGLYMLFFHHIRVLLIYLILPICLLSHSLQVKSFNIEQMQRV